LPQDKVFAKANSNINSYITIKLAQGMKHCMLNAITNLIIFAHI